MNYNIGIHVKVQGCDKYAQIAEPELGSPTFGLGELFRACMDWNYHTTAKDKNGEYQVCYYPCSFVIEKATYGISELENNGVAYAKYSPSNVWGSRAKVWRVLQSLRECIYEQAKEIPIECLYMSLV